METSIIIETIVKVANHLEDYKENYDRKFELEQNKNNYFINLSHELRTPLNVLTSINQLIKNLEVKIWV